MLLFIGFLSESIFVELDENFVSGVVPEFFPMRTLLVLFVGLCVPCLFTFVNAACSSGKFVLRKTLLVLLFGLFRPIVSMSESGAPCLS